MAVDTCHEQMVRALEKDGWHVEASPVKLSRGSRLAYVDVELSRSVNGSRQHMILVEIKCFPDQESTTRDLYVSLGQYLVYRAMLLEIGLSYILYLAVPENIFAAIFDVTVLRAITDSRINVVVINVPAEVVIKWIKQPS